MPKSTKKSMALKKASSVFKVASKSKGKKAKEVKTNIQKVN